MEKKNRHQEGEGTVNIYVNPGNANFAAARRDPIFVDISDLIGFTNTLLNTPGKKLCVTRPRRFGKTLALYMLSAYYSRGCDSSDLFRELEIAEDPSFPLHLNRHHVILLDIQFMYRVFLREGKQKRRTFGWYVKEKVISELATLFPEAAVLTERSLSDTILQIHRVHPDGRFIFLIDEWDFLFREPSVDELTRRDYLDLLGSLFKSGPMDECLDLVYMTGIFPIPRYLKNTQALFALNSFTEYSMMKQRQMGKGKFIGFREETVKELCETWDMPFEDMKDWYDGYRIAGTESVYCPKCVVDSLTERTFLNYWANTSSYMTIQECLNPQIPGLKESLDCLLSGESVPIDPSAFLNNVDTLNTVDEVFGYLVHLGYLSFNQEDSTVSIPNREVRNEFREAVNTDEWDSLRNIVSDARDLLQDIRDGNSGAVAKALENAHDYKLSGPEPYDEASLTAVLRLAFFAAESYYTIIQEFPPGRGFAELSFIPRQSGILPMIVELKWNHTAETATTWVKQGLYRGRLKGRDKVILVEISCRLDPDKSDSPKYSCRIELWPPDETIPPAQAPVPSWVPCTKK